MRRRIKGLRILVAVNAGSLLDPTFMSALKQELQTREFTDSGLMLSIDQNEALMLGQRAHGVRQALRELQVGFCLGRVATDGKSSEILQELAPELIAVDAVSLRAGGQIPPILGLARDCGAEVVAHFIPDAQTLARLFALGVDFGMGSFIGTPTEQLEYDFGDFG
jgi:EAL domain-containing protein (putative c-di-GMP-specific phosphodiesterase class I)